MSTCNCLTRLLSAETRSRTRQIIEPAPVASDAEVGCTNRALHTGQIKTYLMEGVTQPKGEGPRNAFMVITGPFVPEEGSSPLSYKSSLAALRLNELQLGSYFGMGKLPFSFSKELQSSRLFQPSRLRSEEPSNENSF